MASTPVSTKFGTEDPVIVPSTLACDTPAVVPLPRTEAPTRFEELGADWPKIFDDHSVSDVSRSEVRSKVDSEITMGRGGKAWRALPPPSLGEYLLALVVRHYALCSDGGRVAGDVGGG